MQPYVLPTPLAGERLSLRPPLDNYRWAYRIVLERPTMLELSELVTSPDSCRLTVLREKAVNDGESIDVGGCTGSHYECQVWLAGWLHAMAHMLPELLLAEERGAAWMREHAFSEVYSEPDYTPDWSDVLEPKALCEKVRR